MRLILILVALCAWGGAGQAVSASPPPVAAAADQPARGPAPQWVRRVAVPRPSPDFAEAPVQVLLQDQQVAFSRGARTIFTRAVMRIQTPQGLAGGNISLPWRPGADVLTIHKLAIRRGDQLIDVLASGQTFTVLRREANLENATLDGVLTANIQPEGLQVGDEIELEASLTTRDPVTRDHVEFLGPGWDAIPLARAHFRMQWPDALPIRVRQAGGLPALRPIRSGGTSGVELTLDDVRPPTFPNGAPPRFAIGRVIEATDFSTWADLAALLAPLYEAASTMPAEGPLQTELARIRRSHRIPPPGQRLHWRWCRTAFATSP